MYNKSRKLQQKQNNLLPHSITFPLVLRLPVCLFVCLTICKKSLKYKTHKYLYLSVPFQLLKVAEIGALAVDVENVC